MEGGAAKPMDENEKDMTKSSGSTSIMEARIYKNKLHKIFKNFKEDNKNALRSTISEVK